MESEHIQPEADIQPGTSNEYGVPKSGRFREYCKINNQLVLQLCEHRAFDEAEAQRVLCATPEGIAVEFTKKFGERITTAISISRILVFSERPEQRIERCKSLPLKTDPECGTQENIMKILHKFETFLFHNGFYIKEFATITQKHFFGLTNKKNNLFFLGPPSSGKTMIMESLKMLNSTSP